MAFKAASAPQAGLKQALAPDAEPEGGGAAGRRRRCCGDRRGLWIGAAVIVTLAAIGLLVGFLVKASIDRNDSQQAAQAQPVEQRPGSSIGGAVTSGGSGSSSTAAPATAPAAQVASNAVRSSNSTEAADLAADDKAAFLWENQAVHIQEASIFMPLTSEALLVQAQDGSGALPFPYAGPGPCRTLRQFSNITLDLSAAATGCRGLGQCQVGLRVAMPEPGTCPEVPAPYLTVYLIPGFSCQPSYYKTWIERLASWGYAVLTYERPLAGQSQPAAEVEVAYFDSVMAWRNAANTTQRGGRFLGLFHAGPVAVMGHSMGGGLAAIAAGSHPNAVGATILVDPVDYTHLSRLVARQYLEQYRSPVLVIRAAVVCLDRNKCVPPQDHDPTAEEDRAFKQMGYCTADWWCCNWDDGQPGMEQKFGIAAPTDGPTGFVEFAPAGSWMARFNYAGHTSIALEKGSTVFGGTTCPTVLEPDAVIPDAVALAVAYLDSRLRGQAGAEEYALTWANARPAQAIQMSIKGAAPAA